MRSQENTDIFREKCLSRRPDSNQGVATELAWRSIAFLRSSCWRFSALSRRFLCAFTALKIHALHFHGVCTALTACWRRVRLHNRTKSLPVECLFLMLKPCPQKEEGRKVGKEKCQKRSKNNSTKEEASPPPSPHQPRDESPQSQPSRGIPACWRTSDIVKGMLICISRFYTPV